MKNTSKSDFERMAGHWVLARLGKRVLRPGGRNLTRWMLNELRVRESDHIVEIAPGLGSTSREIFSRRPKTYIGVDADHEAITRLKREFEGQGRSFIRSNAVDTGIENNSASVVLGEAFLTMQADSAKRKIVGEISRILMPGGKYGMHELCIISDNPDRCRVVKRDLSEAIRINAAPLTIPEWRELLDANGFETVTQRVRPMELLRLRRLVEDEGILGTARIIRNTLIQPPALRRVLGMRRVFERHAYDLAAISVVAKKRSLSG